MHCPERVEYNSDGQEEGHSLPEQMWAAAINGKLPRTSSEDPQKSSGCVLCAQQGGSGDIVKEQVPSAKTFLDTAVFFYPVFSLHLLCSGSQHTHGLSRLSHGSSTVAFFSSSITSISWASLSSDFCCPSLGCFKAKNKQTLTQEQKKRRCYPSEPSAIGGKIQL